MISEPVNPLQFLKALYPIEVKLMKNCSSSNEVISEFSVNLFPRLVTEAASRIFSSMALILSLAQFAVAVGVPVINTNGFHVGIGKNDVSI